MTERYGHQHGLSVVELMIALLLASFLTMGMVYIFTSNSDTFRLNEASARVQESGRMAVHIMARATRNAGYWGCIEPPEDLECPAGGDGDQPFSCMLNDNVEDTDSMFTTLGGDDDVASGNSFGAVEGTDIIRFGGVDGNSLMTATQRTPVNSATIFSGQDPTDQVDDGDILIISNCQAADVFQVSNTRNNGFTVNIGTGSPGNDRQNQSAYSQGAKFFRPSRTAYYIREDDNGRRSLVFESLDMQAGGGGYTGEEELVSNVRAMQLEYGRDTTGDGKVDQWSAPGNASDAEEALAVRYSFLVRSGNEDVVEEPQSYCYPGWLDCGDNSGLRTTADDRHLYRVYTSVSTLRNRIGK
ncbi:MAG: PilW family protein [Halospina sp.]